MRGNPKRDNTTHVNFEIKGTIFATARILELLRHPHCQRRLLLPEELHRPAAVRRDEDLARQEPELRLRLAGEHLRGACTGDGDDRRTPAGASCAYDTTSNTLRCGIGWLSVKLPVPADVSYDFGSGATTDICLF